MRFFFLLIFVLLLSLTVCSQIENDTLVYKKYFLLSLNERLSLLESKKALGGKPDNILLSDITTLAGFDLRLQEDSVFVLFSHEGIMQLKNEIKFKTVIAEIKKSFHEKSYLRDCKRMVIPKKNFSSLHRTLLSYSRLCLELRIDYLDSLMRISVTGSDLYLVNLIKDDIDSILALKTGLLEKNIQKSYKAVRSKWIKRIKKLKAK